MNAYISIFVVVVVSNELKENWIGGYKEATSQRAIYGDEGLKRALEDSFHLRHEFNIPMMIRETRRKFQYTVCYVTIWQRK